MKKKIANMWITALRSGEYTQGYRALCRVYNGSKTYCCLGVLCDLYQKNQTKNKKKKLSVKTVTTDSFESVIVFGGNAGVLPIAVQNWAGMSSYSGRIPFGGPNLVKMNDNRKTFIEIADHIEKHYKEL
jgi:hypothetical protein